MKTVMWVAVICLVVVVMLFIYKPKPRRTVEPNAETTSSPVDKAAAQAKLQELLDAAKKDKEEKARVLEAEKLKDFLSPAESRRWLQNNHYQVEKKADGSGYIITRDYYDASTESRDNSRYDLGNSGLLVLGNVALTTDKNGELRVAIYE